MGAVVRELYVFRQRGQPGEAVESAWFRRGIGMEGDRHAAGGERQTSLLAGETRDWMEKQTEPGLCFRRYKANLITEGIDTTQLNTGDLLAAGGAVFRVSGDGKKCFPGGIYHEKGVFCRLSAGGLFLGGVRGGVVSVLGEIMKFGKKEGLGWGG